MSKDRIDYSKNGPIPAKAFATGYNYLTTGRARIAELINGKTVLRQLLPEEADRIKAMTRHRR